MFPGAIFRLIKPVVAMLIFKSGSIMTLGVREYSDLLEALAHVRPMLEKHSYPPGTTRESILAAGEGTATANNKGKRGRKSDPETKNMMAAIRAASRLAVQTGGEFRELVEQKFQSIKKEQAEKEAKKAARRAKRAKKEADKPSSEKKVTVKSVKKELKERDENDPDPVISDSSSSEEEEEDEQEDMPDL